MNNLTESSLGIALAPIHIGCVLVSAGAKLISKIFLAEEYNHEETIREGRFKNVNDIHADIWQYAFWMAHQANLKGRRIRHECSDVIIYANPTDNIEKEGNRIIREFYTKWREQEKRIAFQNKIVWFFFPPKKPESIHVVVRRFHRLIGTHVQIDGWGYP